MATIEDIVNKLRSGDKDARIEGVELLEEVIEDSSGSDDLLAENEAQLLLETLPDLIKDNQFKVSQGGLNNLSGILLLTEEETVAPHLGALCPPVIEKLGDGRTQVRTAALEALHGLLSGSMPDSVIERMKSPCRNKNHRAAKFLGDECDLRADVGENMPVKDLVSLLGPLLEDSQANVKEAASNAVVQAYQTSGEPVVSALKKVSIKPRVLQGVLTELKNTVVRDGAPAAPPGAFIAMVEEMAPPSTPPVRRKATAITRADSLNTDRQSRMRSQTTRIGGFERPGSAASDSGGIVEASSTDDVPPVHVSSDKDLEKQLDKILSIISGDAKWDARCDALRLFVGLLNGGAAERSSIVQSQVKSFTVPISTQLTDLRSKVQVEACLLVAALSERLGDDFAPYSDFFMPYLLKMAIISIKVVTENANYAARTMISNVVAPKTINAILDVLKGSKSSIQRQKCIEYLELSLETYPTDAKFMSRTIEPLERMMMKELSAAESEVRQGARRVFWAFTEHWPDRAARLKGRLDPGLVKHLGDSGGGSGGFDSSGGMSGRTASHPVPRRQVTSRATSVPSVADGLRPTSAPGKEQMRNRAVTTMALQPEKATPVVHRAASRKVPSRVMAGPQRVKTQPKEEKEKPERVHSQRTDRSVSSIGHHELKPLPALITMAETLSPSSPWTRRVQVYTDLKKSVTEGGSDAAATVIDKLWVSAIERASDNHPKVAAAVLDLLSLLITIQPSMVHNTLDQALPIICLGLGDGSKAAIACMEAVNQVYDANTVVEALLSGRSLDQPGNKTIQIGVMSSLTVLIPSAAAYFSTNKIMKHTIDKLIPLLQSRLADLRAGAVDVLSALYSTKAEVFAATLASMPFMVIQDVKRFLGSRAHGLNAKLVECRGDVSNRSRSHRSPLRDTHRGDTSPIPSTRKNDDAPPSNLPAAPRRSSTSPVKHDVEEEWTRLNEEVEEKSPPASRYDPDKYEAEEDEDDIEEVVESTPTENWINLVPGLIKTVMNEDGSEESSRRRAALHALTRMSGSSDSSEAWHQYFGQTLLAVVRGVQDDDPTIRLEAVKVVRAMLQNQRDYLAGGDEVNLLRVVSDTLLQSRGSDDTAQVVHAVDDAIHYIADTFDHRVCLELAMPLVKSGVGAVVAPSVRFLTRVLSKLDDMVIDSMLDDVLPGLFEAFKSEVAEARKAVVFCLVDLYMKLGDRLTPFLASLSTTQLKLGTALPTHTLYPPHTPSTPHPHPAVTIYINRQRKP